MTTKARLSRPTGRSLGFIFVLMLFAFAARANPVVSAPSELPPNYYHAEIQPLFNARCIACHSCFESPCQMNLQTYAGAQRGANLLGVYQGDRLQEMAPSRMFEDALTTKEWRGRDFFDVLQGGEKSVFWRLIAAADRRNVYPAIPVRENNLCVRTDAEMTRLEKSHPEFAMPYGLPALQTEEKAKILRWLNAGAPGQIESLGLQGLAADETKIVREWESSLNAKDLKSRVLARYLFEHLFLARFAFPGNHSAFLRLVRSKTPCGQAITPLSPRKPNDDPGVKDWSYCFYRDPAATILKKHIPFEISRAKLKWIRDNFSREAWTPTSFPSFAIEVSRNPFVAFREIPLAARYRFLLEDARYHIMTFIKGPVCNGSVAVNVIQEQFFVFFMDPNSDVMVTDPEFAQKSEKLLVLPGNFDADRSFPAAITDYATLTELRNAYRKLKSEEMEKRFAKGLKLTDIWDGEGKNPNALLTVFRHDDNAEVLFGAQGDLPKTVFLLDYSIFERLVYNLVVNFDVYGDIKHQALTRLYMDLIRMEAENNYLDFLPPAERPRLKREWYRGSLTQMKLNILNEEQFPEIPTALTFTDKPSIHHQMIEKLLFERLSSVQRGEDFLNRKRLRGAEIRPTPETSDLRSLTSISVEEGAYFAKLMPEFSLLALREKGRVTRVYSIIHNREFENISWMFGESLRRDPVTDTLTILEGVRGAYPNDIFVVETAKLQEFSKELRKQGWKKDFQPFLRKYSLSRKSPEFWTVFDQIQEWHRGHDPAEAGYLDLSRYRMDEWKPLNGF